MCNTSHTLLLKMLTSLKDHNGLQHLAKIITAWKLSIYPCCLKWHGLKCNHGKSTTRIAMSRKYVYIFIFGGFTQHRFFFLFFNCFHAPTLYQVKLNCLLLNFRFEILYYCYSHQWMSHHRLCLTINWPGLIKESSFPLYQTNMYVSEWHPF